MCLGVCVCVCVCVCVSHQFQSNDAARLARERQREVADAAEQVHYDITRLRCEEIDRPLHEQPIHRQIDLSRKLKLDRE